MIWYNHMIPQHATSLPLPPTSIDHPTLVRLPYIKNHVKNFHCNRCTRTLVKSLYYITFPPLYRTEKKGVLYLKWCTCFPVKHAQKHVCERYQQTYIHTDRNWVKAGFGFYGVCKVNICKKYTIPSNIQTKLFFLFTYR